MKDKEELIELLKLDYDEVRELKDGTIAALGDLMYTRAIYTGCDEIGWARRFCFGDRDKALEEFKKLRFWYDIPEGYIASRGV